MSNQSRIIEELKDPKQAQPFGLLKKYFPEKAKIIESAFPDGCSIHLAVGEFFTMTKSKKPSNNSTYILKPDYQPESEWTYKHLGGAYIISDKQGNTIARVPEEANAKFICLAANNHDDLLQACKVGLRFTKNTATADAVSITKGDCDDAKTAIKCLQAVIAKPEGETK